MTAGNTDVLERMRLYAGDDPTLRKLRAETCDHIAELREQLAHSESARRLAVLAVQLLAENAQLRGIIDGTLNSRDWAYAKSKGYEAPAETDAPCR